MTDRRRTACIVLLGLLGAASAFADVEKPVRVAIVSEDGEPVTKGDGQDELRARIAAIIMQERVTNSLGVVIDGPLDEIRKIGTPAIPLLIEHLDHPEPSVTKTVRQLLTGTGYGAGDHLRETL